jgi:hypothetical protein
MARVLHLEKACGRGLAEVDRRHPRSLAVSQTHGLTRAKCIHKPRVPSHPTRSADVTIGRKCDGHGLIGMDDDPLGFDSDATHVFGDIADTFTSPAGDRPMLPAPANVTTDPTLADPVNPVSGLTRLGLSTR